MSGVTVDIVIPVFNEGPNIRNVLDSFKAIDLPIRVLICYDFEEDNTLAALRGYDPYPLQLSLVRNRSRGALAAVLTGFANSDAECVVTFPADDDYNGPRISHLIRKYFEGNDIVAASRFMPGGNMEGCPLLKAVLVRSAAFFMYYIARVPTHDASNGLRLFSRRVPESDPHRIQDGFRVQYRAAGQDPSPGLVHCRNAVPLAGEKSRPEPIPHAAVVTPVSTVAFLRAGHNVPPPRPRNRSSSHPIVLWGTHGHQRGDSLLRRVRAGTR